MTFNQIFILCFPLFRYIAGSIKVLKHFFS